MALHWDETKFFVCLQGSESVLQAAAVIAYIFFFFFLFPSATHPLERLFVKKSDPLWFVV